MAQPDINLSSGKAHGQAFGWGAAIGSLGGLIGLGGAEFRLPVLAAIFRFRMLDAIIINLMVSLVTVIFAFLFRIGIATILMGLSRYRVRQTFDELHQFGGFIGWMAAGSILGALIGALLMVYTPSMALHVLLGVILLISAWKLAKVKLRAPQEAG